MVSKEQLIGSQKETKQLESYCGFCDESFVPQVGGGTKEFFFYYPELAKYGQVLKSEENTMLLTDLSPLTKSHLLLIAAQHYPSTASLSPELTNEFEEMAQYTVEKMTNIYPQHSVIAFEHGVGTLDGEKIICGGCGRTDHVHIHFLPIQKNGKEGIDIDTLATDISSEYGLRLCKIKPLPYLQFKDHVDENPYLYLGSHDSQQAHLLIQENIKTNIPSQLIRQLLGERLLGLDEKTRWDWRDASVLHKQEMQSNIMETVRFWREEK